jgi:hypothetical protein
MANNRLIAILAILIVGTFVVVAGVIGYQKYTERYVVKTDDGLAVAEVVQATLSGASDLKVSTLSGTVQSTATDTRGFGMLTSERVIKAPFSVDYFVDMSGLAPSDFGWDAATRTLIVNAPAVRVAPPNIDESRTYIDKTTGMFVTRGAMTALQRQTSARAVQVAEREARKPERIAQAQANARRALSALFSGPLKAAGLDTRVRIRFAGDGRRNDEHWDTTRSLDEVLAEDRIANP